jgi:hypothetical protein
MTRRLLQLGGRDASRGIFARPTADTFRRGACGDVDLDESLEIGPGVFKRLGDCIGSEIEAAIRLIARRRIDRAWIDEQAAAPDHDELTIGRRFFANTTETERDLIAYWHMVKLVEEERLRLMRRMPEGGQDQS